MSRIGSRARVFWSGVRDGFRQPHDLTWSTNVDHVQGVRWDPQEVLDGGINVGQFLRSGFRSQSWRERFWPFKGVPR